MWLTFSSAPYIIPFANAVTPHLLLSFLPSSSPLISPHILRCRVFPFFACLFAMSADASNPSLISLAISVCSSFGSFLYANMFAPSLVSPTTSTNWHRPHNPSPAADSPIGLGLDLGRVSPILVQDPSLPDELVVLATSSSHLPVPAAGMEWTEIPISCIPMQPKKADTGLGLGHPSDPPIEGPTINYNPRFVQKFENPLMDSISEDDEDADMGPSIPPSLSLDNVFTHNAFISPYLAPTLLDHIKAWVRANDDYSLAHPPASPISPVRINIIPSSPEPLPTPESTPIPQPEFTTISESVSIYDDLSTWMMQGGTFEKQEGEENTEELVVSVPAVAHDVSSHREMLADIESFVMVDGAGDEE